MRDEDGGKGYSVSTTEPSSFKISWNLCSTSTSQCHIVKYHVCSILVFNQKFIAIIHLTKVCVDVCVRRGEMEERRME